MNIRCSFCQTPYTLSRVEMIDALQEMDSKKLTHYDAHCPRCRRATPIPRQRMEMFMPKWRDELKEFEAEMKENPQQEAPLPAPASVAATREAAPVAETASTPEPKKATAKKPAAKPEPNKAPAAQKPAAATKSSKEKKTTKKSK
jgi:hypothetical protein